MHLINCILDAGVPYNVSVAAVNMVGRGKGSSIVNFAKELSKFVILIVTS